MTNTIPPIASQVAPRSLPCRLCWAQPGRPCTVSGPPGDHLARHQDAETAGLLTRDGLAAIVAGLAVIAAHVIVPERAA